MFLVLVSRVSSNKGPPSGVEDPRGTNSVQNRGKPTDAVIRRRSSESRPTDVLPSFPALQNSSRSWY